MSAEIATLDRVRLAADQLRKRGVKPTADRVTDLIGGGSRSTVLGHLRALRDQPRDDEELPHEVLETSRSAADQIFRAGRKAEADKTKAASERLSRTMEELDAQIAELEDRNGALEAGTGLAMERERSLASELSSVRAEVDTLRAENHDLRRQLDDERKKTHSRVGDTVTRIEELLAKAQNPGAGQARRSTLRLPPKRNDSGKQ